eukprot:TRINITY_DN116305_c0_g1_i1.p2 TRINITY_DN116305_c0_g1~~TRINITY_DN116305_c0_g1_i1.p2  ORF type:complete len:119 (-),score=16.09 TRINITY_DN116305_c0_g1_i1:74-430(-)
MNGLREPSLTVAMELARIWQVHRASIGGRYHMSGDVFESPLTLAVGGLNDSPKAASFLEVRSVGGCGVMAEHGRCSAMPSTCAELWTNRTEEPAGWTEARSQEAEILCRKGEPRTDAS